MGNGEWEKSFKGWKREKLKKMKKVERFFLFSTPILILKA
jgi:hypothetical protein